MSLQQLMSSSLVQELGWTLVHSLWEGLAAGLLVMAATRLLVRSTPQVRYLVGCVGLLVTCALVVGTFWTIHGRGTPADDAHGRELLALPSPSQIHASDVAPVSIETPPHPTPLPGASQSPARAPWKVQITRVLEAAFPWLVGLWSIGVVGMSLWHVGGWIAIQRLKTLGTRAVSQDIQARLERLRSRLGVKRAVGIVESALVQVPVVVGWIRPMILLPAAVLSGLTPAQLEAILAHELAHVRRHDYVINLLQAAVETLMFYHPAVWWLSRRIRIEREQCCDDIAVAVCGNPIGYAEALSAVAEIRMVGPALAAGGSGGQELAGRIRRVLGMAQTGGRPGGRVLAGIAVLVSLLVLVGELHLPLRAQDARATTGTYRPIVPDSEPTSDVTGSVTDDSGRPVVDAPVLAVRGWESGERRTVRTDADGHFSFRSLKPDGDWHFSVNDPRYGWEWLYERGTMVPAKPEELPIAIMLYRARTLHGTVVGESGKPVAGVRVVLVNQKLPGRKRAVSGHLNDDFLVTQTDQAGRFTMERLRPGTADFVLEHPDYANTLVGDIGVDDRDVVLKISKGLALRGRVTHDGRPVAGVTVQAGLNEAHRPIVDWKGKTDADGRFEAPHVRSLPPRRWASASPSVVVSVQDDKWYSDSYDVYQMTDEELPMVAIEAKPVEPGKTPGPRRVAVGQPAARPTANGRQAGPGGAVNVHVPGVSSARAMVLAISMAAGEHVFQTQRDLNQERAAFDDLPPGRYTFSVFGGADSVWAARPPKVVEVVSGQKLDVTLEPGPGQIRGVVRSGGKVVSGGHLSWFASPPIRRAVFQGTALFQADGSYTITGLAEGKYRLIWGAPESMPHTSIVEVAKEPAVFDINLPTGWVEGTLVGRTPKPRDPAGILGSIFVRPRGIPPMLRNSGCFVEADADGHFSVEHLAPGQYSITGYGYAAVATVEREGSVVAAALRPAEKAGEIAGAIRGDILSMTGDDHNTVQVTAFRKDEQGYDWGEWNYSTQCNSRTGSYRLRGLPVGTYGVWVCGLGFQSPFPGIWIPDVEVREGLSRDLSVNVPQGRRVSLRVHDRLSMDRTSPVCRSWRLRMPSGDWLDRTILVGSGMEGDFALPLGEYTIEADYGEHGMVTRAFTVVEGNGTQKISVRGD